MEMNVAEGLTSYVSNSTTPAPSAKEAPMPEKHENHKGHTITLSEDVNFDLKERTLNKEDTQGIAALEKAIDQINKKMQSSEVHYAIHEETDRVVIKIVDRESQETIKEFPPEKTLDMIAKAWELAGLMVDEKC